ncbi:hypothetical protein DXG03_008306 [Asterophora parasitica]|uniref:TRAPP trafficking subunit Trs65-domain-containing protein n=1 Tax=Asterophora parasitica TaxID=117018 RepID=A0A9P7G7S3_9AGAR|nr:hypothetical protein DXG03_008306 [Asterophora parasitica]
MSFEQLFASSVLNVVVPDTSIEYPPQEPADLWLERLRGSSVERNQAFFDEQLQALLTVRIDHPSSVPPEPKNPPQALLTFLAHTQVSLEATYISSVPAPNPDLRTSRLSAPPRTAPLSKTHARLQVHAHHPSILPPSTPNPTPSSADHDRRYVTSEGTLLLASIWGQDTSEDSKEGFALLWSEKSPLSPNGMAPEEKEDAYDRLEEVNLLEGLLAGPTFGENSINLPSTRLGTVSRQKLFSLPPVSLPALATPSPSPMTAIRTAHPTLRKSYRRTLQTVSGFRVRMRTVFVPYVLLPDANRGVDFDETQEEQERREAGNEERTVVLCVEVENSGESGPGIGFMVEKVDVAIGGEGAKATLIGWGEGCFNVNVEEKTFPLRIGAMAQYNLLYAVSFLRAPEEIEGFSLVRDSNNYERVANSGGSELQRAVAINIFGKPYAVSRASSDTEAVYYPTTTFSSRWNCVLDLSSHHTHSVNPLDGAEDFSNGLHALPEPASPFPVSATPRTASFTSPNGGHYSAGSTPQSSATPGSKRHTLPGGNITAARSIKASAPSRASSMLNPGSISARGREQPPLPGASPRMSYIPPSVSIQIPRSPTTYSAPPPPNLAVEAAANHSSDQYDQLAAPPMTPAYPAYPPLSTVPPSPISQGPIASHNIGNVGPSVEIRRERGLGMGGAPMPQTPGPWVTGAFGEQKMLARMQMAERTGESIVVSVGLLPLVEGRRKAGFGAAQEGPGKIYPLDYFTLDIFVFNQSEWTRRFEVTCPARRRRRKMMEDDGAGHDGMSSVAKKNGFPGILPLDARVRIGCV